MLSALYASGRYFAPGKDGEVPQIINVRSQLELECAWRDIPYYDAWKIKLCQATRGVTFWL
jgi:hypothetical protein